MFIRRSNTNNKATGEAYFTFRLVRGERIAGKVRQITVLNLGRHFPILQEDWPLLCSRIEQLLAPQELLLAMPCPDHIERFAQRYVSQLVARAGVAGDAADQELSAAAALGLVASGGPDIQAVDIDSLQLTQPRSVGVEHLALHALGELGLVQKLTDLGINGVMRASILGNLVARMAAPASEAASWDWLQTHSALGELLDVDFEGMSHMRLYRASDLLMKHRAAIETHLFSAATELFDLQETVTLYDLTNTYFEGEEATNPKAQNGRSKEKRSDCPLVTLALVLDGSGFVRRSRTFAGNVSEGKTLSEMLTDLGAPAGALVVMDAGISTEANLAWLVANGYRYLVVRRGGARQFDAAQSEAIETAGGETVRLHKVTSPDGREVQLHCHSEGREAKESAMMARFCSRFEAGLKKINDGLSKPRGDKSAAKLLERIGRLKQKSRGASQHYTVNLVTDETDEAAVQKTTKKSEKVVKKMVTALTWEKHCVAATMATHPGVYCLRSNELNWDAEKLWRTYTMLTDLESVFRSLKSELGLRPVFHSKEKRTDGHLFITVLAYQCVQVLRVKLKAAGINDCWTTLRNTLAVQRRVTTSLRRTDGRTLHVRKSTNAEPALMRIYQALGLNASPGGIKKLIV